jgi:hypothetical protein
MFKLDDLVTYLGPFFKDVWKAVVPMFERHPARIGVSAIFLVAALVIGNFYIARTKQYQEILSTTIRAEGEDTPQRFKVLEAFIMSTIDPKLREIIENATISDDFSRGLQALHGVLSMPTPDAPLAGGVNPPIPECGVKLSIPDYINNHKQLPLQKAILTDNARIGYLFSPLNLLRPRLENDYEKIFYESLREPYSRTLAAAVAIDRAIADDIAISCKLASDMKQFTQMTTLFKEVDELEHLGADVRPAQVYYITKNGVNRIVKNGDARTQQYVDRNMFRSTTFFPSRPYYVEAFKHLTPATLAVVTGITKDSFYVSQPYLDLGGFGVVITLARPVSYASHSDAAICFDLRVSLKNDIAFPLNERLKSFGATIQKVACQIGNWRVIGCNPINGGSLDSRLKLKLENRLSKAMNTADLSTVVGNISIIDDQASSEGGSKTSFLDFFNYPVELIFGKPRPITFSIPLDSPRASSAGNDNVIEVQFMISSLDLGRFRQNTSLLGLASVSLLAMAFFVVLFSWHGEMLMRQNFQEAFENVDGVLYEAPIAYCRLSAEDTIVKCNTEFCRLLNKPANSESVRSIEGNKFEDLLTQESKETYQKIQEKRRAGDKGKMKYTLSFKDGGGSKVQVMSGVIPGRTPHELPETFGILFSERNSPSSPTGGASSKDQLGS